MNDCDVLQTCNLLGVSDRRKRIKGFYSSRRRNQPVISRAVTERVSVVFTARMGCSFRPGDASRRLAMRVTAVEDHFPERIQSSHRRTVNPYTQLAMERSKKD